MWPGRVFFQFFVSNVDTGGAHFGLQKRDGGVQTWVLRNESTADCVLYQENMNGGEFVPGCLTDRFAVPVNTTS